jgi:hypothetical protein
VSAMLLLLPMAALVVIVANVVVEVVAVFVVAMILEVVVKLVVMSLANVLTVAVVSILWIFVGSYTANHLVLPIKLFLWRILQLFLDHLLVQVLLQIMISSLFRKMSMLSFWLICRPLPLPLLLLLSQVLHLIVFYHPLATHGLLILAPMNI